jgi:hypothetical protein
MANGNGKAVKTRSVGTNLVAGAANTIYTCPPNHAARVELLFVSNHSSGGGGGGGSTKTVSIQWHDISLGTSYYIVGGYSLTATAFLKLDGSYLALSAGDYLVATPEAGSTMDATVSVEEYYDPLNNG